MEKREREAEGRAEGIETGRILLAPGLADVVNGERLDVANLDVGEFGQHGVDIRGGVLRHLLKRPAAGAPAFVKRGEEDRLIHADKPELATQPLDPARGVEKRSAAEASDAAPALG